MRAESNTKPENVIIETKTNGMCDVIINCNISEPLTKTNIDYEGSEVVDGDSSVITYYEYDSYRLCLPFRNGLADIIKNDFDTWVAYAAEVESTPEEISDKEKINQLTIANQKLITDNQTLKDDNELLKGCIMELADIVYA